MRVAGLMPWINAALAFLYPEICQLCRQARATPSAGFVCDACRRKVRYIERPFCEKCGRPSEGAIETSFVCGHCRETELHFSTARSAAAAKDTVLEVIHRYKYQRALWFEPFLAHLLIDRAAPELRFAKWDWIVPVPLHPRKQREREFNQAERLARRLAAGTGIPLNVRLLRRIVPTRTQTQLTRDERLENVRRAFAMLPGRRLNGERIVLVDDVLTTGATTSACAKVLVSAGAAEVCVWTVARGL